VRWQQTRNAIGHQATWAPDVHGATCRVQCGIRYSSIPKHTAAILMHGPVIPHSACVSQMLTGACSAAVNDAFKAMDGVQCA
jgi:hypothetical protein